MSTDTSADAPVVKDNAESLLERLDMLRQACSAALSVDELVVVAVAQAKAATLAAGGVLFLLDGEELTVAASSGYPAELVSQWSRFALSSDTPAGTAARERRAQWFSQPLEKAGRHPDLAPERTGYVALAALPVMSGESVHGVLGISFRDARVFSPVERLFLLLLAEQVGVALGRVRDVNGRTGIVDHVLLTDPVRRQTVNEVLGVIDESRTTVNRATVLARTFCDVGSAQFSLIGDEQVLAGGSGATAAIGSVNPVTESLCTVAMSLQSPLIVTDAMGDDRVADLPPVLTGNVRAYLGVPVSVCGVLVGALCVYDASPRQWSMRQRQFIESLALTLGTELTLRTLAARDAQLLQTAEIQLRLLDRLATAESLRQAVAVLLEAVAEVDGVAGAALVVTGEQTSLRFERSHCSSPAAAVTLGALAVREPKPGNPDMRLLELNGLIDALLGDAAHLVELGAQRVAQVAITAGATIGSLAVALTEQADTGRVRRELAALARFGGAVLDRAATYDRHQLATSRATFLQTAWTHMEASLDVDGTLQRMARIAAPALAEGCLVYLVEPDGLRLAAVGHPDARVEERIRVELGCHPAFIRLAESALDEPVMAGDKLPRWLRAERVWSTPMKARGELVGVITLLDLPPDGLPRLADKGLMTDLAAHAAIAIDNAMLYARRSAEVFALQRRLLPSRLPVLPEFELAAFYEAGDRSLDVGGDFYDVITVAGDRLVLVIGDVCGRGADAASITALARAVLRTAIRDGASPAQALQHLNDAMRTTGDHGEFCTAVVMQIDGRGDDCRLRIAVGGHPLPLLRRAGVTREIGRHGPMLGMLPTPVFRESETQLNCDDVVVLYTDGITEARQGDEFFGPRLAPAVTAAGQSAEKAVAHALRAVEKFRDQSNDDVAMLAFRPRGRSLARIVVPEVRDPSCRPAVFAMLGRTLPENDATRRLARRVGAAIARVQLSSTGPVHVDVLRTPGSWRVEICRPEPPDHPARRPGSPAAPTSRSTHRVHHGTLTLESIEVATGNG